MPHEIAEELVQDAALKCVKAEKLGQVILPAYFRQAAYTCMIDYIRLKKLQTVSIQQLLEEAGKEPSVLPPEIGSEEEEDAILDQLTPRQAIIVLLRREGYQHREIEKLRPDITLDASKKLLSRARRRIRRNYGENPRNT
jgi:DNA-directed RNA polymerase specialized sigma24 family protein